MGDGVLDSFVVDSHPVDDGLVFDKTEASWLRVAFLWFGSYASYLNEAEPQVSQSVIGVAAFVQACGQSNGILEFDSKHLFFQFRLAVFVKESYQVGDKRYPVQKSENRYYYIVYFLRLEQKEYASY